MSDWLGWHFSVNCRLDHGDGRRIRPGVTHRIEGPLVLCQHGLHASARALDALAYASLSCTHVARIRLSGDRVDDQDKSVASERTYLAVIPVRPVLNEFACRCAEAVLMIADVDDERCWQAIHVKREWLAGRATDTELAAARDAANAARAARDAARAARDAAWDAARATRSAAWDAGDAAWDAARAARDATRAAARDATRAARDAAWDAARAEINDLLESMLLEAMGLES